MLRDDLALTNAAREAARAAALDPDPARAERAAAAVLPGRRSHSEPRPAVGELVRVRVSYRSPTTCRWSGRSCPTRSWSPGRPCGWSGERRDRRRPAAPGSCCAGWWPWPPPSRWASGGWPPLVLAVSRAQTAADAAALAAAGELAAGRSRGRSGANCLSDSSSQRRSSPPLRLRGAGGRRRGHGHPALLRTGFTPGQGSCPSRASPGMSRLIVASRAGIRSAESEHTRCELAVAPEARDVPASTSGSRSTGLRRRTGERCASFADWGLEAGRPCSRQRSSRP